MVYGYMQSLGDLHDTRNDMCASKLSGIQGLDDGNWIAFESAGRLGSLSRAAKELGERLGAA